jgi:hypothetical protein
MDSQAFNSIFQRQFEELRDFIQREGVLSPPELRGRKLFVPIEGVRRSGARDHFLAVVDGGGFPVYPYDVGFTDPETPRATREGVQFKDSKWFPFDNERSFKTAFERDPRVFVCIQPGFSREYFVHHTKEQWNPHVWSLLQIVTQIRQALNAETYVQPNWERI